MYILVIVPQRRAFIVYIRMGRISILMEFLQAEQPQRQFRSCLILQYTLHLITCGSLVNHLRIAVCNMLHLSTLLSSECVDMISR